MTARKQTTTPSRIWTYGLPFGPIKEHREMVDHQIWLSRLYYNELLGVAIESRKRFRDARARIVPGYAALNEVVEDLVEQKRAIDDEIKATNMKARKKGAATPEQKARKKEIVAKLKETRAKFEPLKSAQKEISDYRRAQKNGGELPVLSKAARRLKEESESINAWKSATGKELRKKYGECAWGTRGRVDESIMQANSGKRDPRFRSWDGRGNVAVQIAVNSETNRGRLFTEGLLACTDSRLRLEIGELKSSGNPKQAKRRAVLWIRVGSEGRKKSPVWAKFSCVYHRPLPPGAEIKAAWAQRRRIGTKYRWELCLQLESESFSAPQRMPSHRCAVKLGWSEQKGKRIRVAYVVGTDGKNEEFLLPKGVVERLEHAEGSANTNGERSLRGLRDEKFNHIRDEVNEWLRPRREDIPEWLAEITKDLGKWRSPNRMTKLYHKWRENRFDGDSEVFERLEHWKRRDWHLLRYQAGESENARGHRKDRYRAFARQLAERYSEIVVQEFDLRKPQRKREPGHDEGEQSRRQRLNRTRAALSELMAAFKLASSNTGASLVVRKKVEGAEAQSVSTTCNVCGADCQFDRSRSLRHTCERCGAEWDKDENHCRNLLGFSVAEAAE